MSQADTVAKGRNEPSVTPELVAEHGLSPAEYDRLLTILGREPNLLELGIFSVMWSEHCSYKSSKKWLKTLPTEGPQVIIGPGENAGVVDIGDGLAAVFKIESHNHPSFIEPYQGAATGVGGILRDVFTMGARPVANLNALRFGDPDAMLAMIESGRLKPQKLLGRTISLEQSIEVMTTMDQFDSSGVTVITEF